MQTLAEALADLRAQGETTQEIARYLEEEKCFGVPWHPYRCPIAVYLNKRTGKTCDVEPGLEHPGRVYGCGDGRRPDEPAALPALLNQLAIEIDDRRFPALVGGAR